MCDEESNNIGDVVPDDVVLYRALDRKNQLSDDKKQIREIAFQKAGKLPKHKDGLSFRTSAEACNTRDHYGILEIKVGDIHGLERNLEVRFDANDPSHILLRNLPCIDREEEKERAEAVSSELAWVAKPHSITPYKRPRSDPKP